MLFERQMKPVLEKRVLSLSDVPSLPEKRSREKSPVQLLQEYAPRHSNSPATESSSEDSYEHYRSDPSYLESWDASQGAFGPIVAADALLSGQSIFGNAPGLLDEEHHHKPSPDSQQDEMHSDYEMSTMVTGADWTQQEMYSHQVVREDERRRYMPGAPSTSEYMLADPNLLTQLWRQRGPVTWRG